MSKKLKVDTARQRLSNEAFEYLTHNGWDIQCVPNGGDVKMTLSKDGVIQKVKIVPLDTNLVVTISDTYINIYNYLKEKK